MDQPAIVTILTEFRGLYLGLSVLTAGAIGGCAWALVKFGISKNAGDIARISGHTTTLFERTNTHNAEISRLDERSKAI